MPQSGNVSKFMFVCSFSVLQFDCWYFGFGSLINPLIPILQTQESKLESEHFLPSLEQIEESSLAIHSSAPCRGSSASVSNASSPKPAHESFEVLPEVERDFDEATQVGSFCFSSDSEILDPERP